MRAGFDGVELHAGHGYLIDEFLSPGNTRDDGWGGTLEGRARLLVEVIRAIRKRVGRDFPLWIRINAVEPHKADGERWDDQLQVIDLAVAAGIDAVHVTVVRRRLDRPHRLVRAACRRPAGRLRRRGQVSGRRCR